MRTIADVMSSEVQTVTTSAVVGAVRDLMLDRRIHAVAVLDLSGAVVGIITSSDLVEEHAPQLGVTSVMIDSVLTIGPDDTLVDAARTMLDDPQDEPHDLFFFPSTDSHVAANEDGD